MLGTYYYHEIIRKTIVAFGTLFNDIHVRKQGTDSPSTVSPGVDVGSEIVISDLKVPLAYAPQAKFLARMEQQARLDKPVAITLPRMSFEMVGISYDAPRKTNTTKSFKAVSGDDVKKVFLPVPYNLQFELSIYTKLNEDALQIIEQILPVFQPSFRVTVDLLSSIGEKRDIPITLDSINIQDEYEGNFTERRALIYTLQFTANTYLFGPIPDSNADIIRKVQVDYHSNTNRATSKRDSRYTVVPDPISAQPGDDFGFTETFDYFEDSKSFNPFTGTDS
jgi:hypothetical protein